MPTLKRLSVNDLLNEDLSSSSITVQRFFTPGSFRYTPWTAPEGRFRAESIVYEESKNPLIFYNKFGQLGANRVGSTLPLN
jgi:hypothetical protein